MLSEYENVRQEKKNHRRLFRDDKYNLYVWYEKKNGKILGFQIIYNLEDIQKAFTYEEDNGYYHNEVDGWDNTAYKGTPLLVQDGKFGKNEMYKIMKHELANIETDLRAYILNKILEYELKI
jgi:hypothetical protein